MKKFEYKVLTKDFLMRAYKTVEDGLNRYGYIGYELISIEKDEYVFKRETSK